MTPSGPKKPSDDLILFRDGDSKLVLAYRRGNGERFGIAKSTMDGVNWKDSNLARGAMFDPGTDAVPITVDEARKLHPNLVLPDEALPGWDDFASRLTGVLSELEAEEYVVLESTVNRRFVQVAFQDFAIRVESVGEQYLQPSAALTAEQVAELENLGYDSATHSADETVDASEGSPNYWMELPTNAPRGSVATLMVDTLRRVHLVESPRDLTYGCGHLVHGHIPQPSLGIGRIAQA